VRRRMARVRTMSSSGNTVAVVEFYQWALLALQLQCLASSSDSLLTVPELQNMQIGSRSSAQSLEPQWMHSQLPPERISSPAKPETVSRRFKLNMRSTSKKPTMTGEVVETQIKKMQPLRSTTPLAEQK
jgi:hypothetical protein